MFSTLSEQSTLEPDTTEVPTDLWARVLAAAVRAEPAQDDDEWVDGWPPLDPRMAELLAGYQLRPCPLLTEQVNVGRPARCHRPGGGR